MSGKAFQILFNQIKNKPNSVIGFASGKTVIGLYSLLTKSRLDFSKIKTFNLDELYPIKRADKQSYDYYMHKNLFNKININKENINLLDGSDKDVKKECANYERKIKDNPVDLQILGLGVNGHVAFNEPGSLKSSKTRLINLSKSTLNVNKSKIKKALTVGISTILKSKKLLLLASGKSKAKAIQELVEDKENINCPASLLKSHKDFTVIIDEKAGSLIK